MWALSTGGQWRVINWETGRKPAGGLFQGLSVRHLYLRWRVCDHVGFISIWGGAQLHILKYILMAHSNSVESL